MASNFINNLSNTYRGSPSLQNQFATEQDYLDLFDNNKTTPAMAQAYVPVDDTSEIKSITNTAPTIINQVGGDNDGPTGPPPGDPSFDYETAAYDLNNATFEEKGITEAEQKGLEILREAEAIKKTKIAEGETRGKEREKNILEAAEQDKRNRMKELETNIQNQIGQSSLDIAKKLLRRELEGNHEAFVQSQINTIKKEEVA